MGLSEIISDSIKYPFSDIQKFLIVGVFALLAGLNNIVSAYDIDSIAIIGIASIVGLIASLIVSGYGVKVIKNAINFSNEVPDFDFVNDLITGIKVLIISIVYLIIPLIIILLVTGVNGLIGASINHLWASIGVAFIIALIIAIIFAIFQIVALARFAYTEQLGDAFNFGEVFEDVKKIGILRIIGFLLISAIVFIIALVIASIFGLIPFIGIIIVPILLGAFCILFYNRGLGLLYGEVI